MASTSEEMTRHFEQQAQAQREQFDMIRAQQKSIDSLKQMLSQLLEDKKKKPKAKTPSKKFKGKRKEGESSSSNSESSKPPYEEGGYSENESAHSKRMRKLEQRLEALTN